MILTHTQKKIVSVLGVREQICSKKVCIVKFSQKGTFFSHKSMMMVFFLPHIYNYLAYMGRLAKNTFDQMFSIGRY